MAYLPNDEVADARHDSPRVRFIKWRKLIGDAELSKRLGCGTHTFDSVCKSPSAQSYRLPSDGLAFKIERASSRVTADERARARFFGLKLPITYDEIEGGWG